MLTAHSWVLQCTVTFVEAEITVNLSAYTQYSMLHPD